MPPREKEFSAVVLVVDVGLTSSSSGYLAQATQCATELLQRKLMSESSDRFGLVLCGTNGFQNPLEYDHVTLLNRPLKEVDWEFMDFVGNHMQGTNLESDWLDAIVVALHFLKEQTETSKKCISKKIVLLSDVGCPVNDSNLEIIVQNLKKENVELLFFSPDWSDDDSEDWDTVADGHGDEIGHEDGDRLHKKPRTKQQAAAEAMLLQIINATNGIQCPIMEAMAQFQYMEKRAKKPFPWKVTLEIGAHVRINTVGYIQIRREPPKTWKKSLARPPVGAEEDELKPDTAFVKNNENQEVVESEDVIEGYSYGKQLITLTEKKEANQRYDGGPKSMIVFGFIKEENIQRQYLNGDGCMVFQPIPEDEGSLLALSALAQAMYETCYVGLVRRVYRQGSTPRIGGLFPECIKNENDETELRLVYIEFPYADDIRDYTFAPVFTEKTRPSPEQLQAIDDLIDSMMLATENEETHEIEEDLLDTTKVMNPTYQHMFRCLAHRALKPGQNLPELSSEIKALLKPPEEILRSSKVRQALENVSISFPREEVITSKERVTGDKLFSKKRSSEPENEEDNSKRIKIEDLSLNKNIVTEVGTANPVKDFEGLLKEGQEIVAVAQQLENVILKLIQTSFGNQMYDKICSCLQAYRNAAMEKNKPELYNDYLHELKHTLESIQKADLLLELAGKEIGLIGASEHPRSRLSDQEVKSFFELSHAHETDPIQEERGKDNEDDDMLDDL